MTKAHRLITRKSSITRSTGSSPQAFGARQREAMAKQQHKGLGLGIPINFLLGCSNSELANFQLARLAAVADLRAQKQVLEDQIVDQQGLAWLAAWFLSMDRPALKVALEDEESALEWAKRMVRERQRGEEERDDPIPPLPVGATHLAAALRYQERNIAEGKCQNCPKPLDPNSVRYCTEHLAVMRARMSRRRGAPVPGSREYLYAGDTPQTHGRQPGTLASLAISREKKTRAVLSELGIPPESRPAVTLHAAKEALLALMPKSEAGAMTPAQLFDAALVPSRQTGHKALRGLLSEGKIQRTGKGATRDPFRYCNGTKKNESLAQSSKPPKTAPTTAQSTRPPKVGAWS